ncbi:MAG: hypothetical protein PHW95_04635 [Patescibacteria group bacterium]|nr:hypothetical protein [Patescibacteria group bacterium]
MPQNFDSLVDELKHCLTLQLEAYQKKDWHSYRQLERKILEIEQSI